MCGISCILALDGHGHLHEAVPVTIVNGNGNGNGNGEKLRALDEELDASLELIKHRGPDSRGQWISADRRVALGHVRLAINDLSADGAQPFHDSAGSVHAVVNGELYDYDRIRADLLEKTAYTFKGRSDCEIVIALYKYYGLSFLSHLRGEFALVLYDERSQLFVAARDRYGVKPLFWTIVDGRLLVAAEAKAFLPLGWQPEWDVRSLMDAGWRCDQRTVFKGVQTLRPGCYLTVQSFGFVETREFWDMEFRDKRVLDARTEEEMVEQVREHIVDSVRARLRADVPVGVYLSGGLDSNAIAGIVTHLVRERGEAVGNDKEGDRVSCFNVAFDEDSGLDESSIADRTAVWLNVKLHKAHMNEAELAARFEDATWHCEHHNPDLNYVGKYALSEVAVRNGFKVVLTGEGADEVFGGYSLFLPDYLQEPDQACPSRAFPEEQRVQRHQDEVDSVRNFYQETGAGCADFEPSVSRRMLNNITALPCLSGFGPDVFAEWTSACYGDCDPQSTLANTVNGQVRDEMLHRWHPLHAALYTETKGHLPNIFLSCLGDRTEMAHSVEARTPFLDHKLTEYVNGLPPSMKIRWIPAESGGGGGGEGRFVEKWILKEACRPFITEELYAREKHAYSAPTTYPVDGPLHRLFSGLITSERVQRLGFVSWAKAQALLERAFVRREAEAIRTAFCLAQWVVLAERFGVRQAGT